jgi:hypothetical protein
MFLEEIQEKQLLIIKRYAEYLPKEILKTSPKISRGENYKGLPWLVLDNPRHFMQKNIFAIRTMFWWGKHFSITLHLSGELKNIIQKEILKNKSLLEENSFFISTGEKEWEHDHTSDNYRSIGQFDENETEKILAEHDFLKLSVKIPIDDPAKSEDDLLRNFEVLLRSCCQLPNR